MNLESRLSREKAANKVAEPRRTGAIDEDEHALLDEVKDPAQPDEPGAGVRTLWTMRSGCG
jgi:hypothetical protein